MATISTPRAQSPAPQSIQSPTISHSPPATPSSSVHASLDLPRVDPRSTSPAPPNASQRRNRVALRDYYNLKSRAPAPPRGNASRTTSIASTASDGGITFTLTAPDGVPVSSESKSQLDEADFDADAYVQGLLKSSSLRTLLKAEGSLVSEIKNLDGERKALVYDNYSKLITVTQTLGTMHKGMDDAGGGTLGSIPMLEPALDAVAKSAAGFSKDNTGDDDDDDDDDDRDIARRREQRASMRQRRAQRETVRWVLGTPARLQQSLEMGQWQEAEAVWEEVRQLLERWKDVRGSSELRAKCEEIMSRNHPTVGPDG